MELCTTIFTGAKGSNKRQTASDFDQRASGELWAYLRQRPHTSCGRIKMEANVVWGFLLDAESVCFSVLCHKHPAAFRWHPW